MPRYSSFTESAAEVVRFRDLLPAALSHIGLGAVTLSFPALVASAAGLDAAATAHYVSLAMLALGAGTLFQCYGRRGLGSGYLLPSCFTVIYLPNAIFAAKAGGLPAVAGMTIVAGATEVALSHIVMRLRYLIPASVIGVTMMMLGALIGEWAMQIMLGFANVGAANAGTAAPAVAAFVIVVGVSVWGNAAMRPVAPVIGVLVGLAISLLLSGPVTQSVTLHWADILTVPTPVMPIFSLELLPGFVIGAAACTVRATADLVLSQRIRARNWKRPDPAPIVAGLRADGFATIAAGFVGLPGTNTYSASVGLAAVTGQTSRSIGLAVGIAWVLLGLTSFGARFVMAIPMSVLAAPLLYAASFVFKAGIEVVNQQLLDSRRALVVGIALIISVAYEAPFLHGALPQEVIKGLGSSLVVAMIVGIVLNALFRIGTSQRARLDWHAADGQPALQKFLRQAGSVWGARVEAVQRAQKVLDEFAEFLPQVMNEGTSAALQIDFDELSLTIRATWKGHAPSERTEPDLDAKPDVISTSVALQLIKHWSDDVKLQSITGDQHELQVLLEDQ